MPTIGVKIRVFVPKEVFNETKAYTQVSHVMTQKTGPDLRREFARTYRSWDHQPNFQQDHYFGVRVMWVKVFTYSQQYRLVNAGARPHSIFPKHAGRMLHFRTGYKPKTRPRLIGSFTGGKFGDYISTPMVHHPGFEGREFDQTIAEEYQETFRDDIQEAIKKGLP